MADLKVLTWDFDHDTFAVLNMEISSPDLDQHRHPRILALDFGSRRIGLAVSDELGLTAQGLPTLERTNKRNDLDHLRRVIKQYGVCEIVMGLPLRLSGDAGIQSEKVEVFAEELRKKFKLPVHLFDERLTSVEANRVLRESEMSIRRRAEVVDQLAATLILQSFLAYRGSRSIADASEASDT
jgi:putative Holliday junction resolvase